MEEVQKNIYNNLTLTSQVFLKRSRLNQKNGENTGETANNQLFTNRKNTIETAYNGLFRKNIAHSLCTVNFFKN